MGYFLKHKKSCKKGREKKGISYLICSMGNDDFFK